MIVATGNAKKLAELQLLLGERFGPITKAPPGLSVEEDAPDFAGNACKKVLALKTLLAGQGGSDDEYLVADDSGLVVSALNGRPGVRSARLGADESKRLGECAPTNQDKGCRDALLRLMENVADDRRQAQLVCALALLAPEQRDPQIFFGALDGHIIRSPRGDAGFGYDPLFVPSGETQTLAELGATYKNAISHRWRAIQALLAAHSSSVATSKL